MCMLIGRSLALSVCCSLWWRSRLSRCIGIWILHNCRSVCLVIPLSYQAPQHTKPSSLIAWRDDRDNLALRTSTSSTCIMYSHDFWRVNPIPFTSLLSYLNIYTSLHVPHLWGMCIMHLLAMLHKSTSLPKSWIQKVKWTRYLEVVQIRSRKQGSTLHQRKGYDVDDDRHK